jgi:hypothetical protein
MTNKKIRPIHVCVAALVGAATLMAAGCGDERSETVVAAQQQAVNLDQLTALLNQVLPAWDERVLAVKDGVPWSADMAYDDLFAAVGDKPIPLSADVGRISDGARVARLDRRAGRARYISRQRAWTLDRAGIPFGDDSVALQAVRRALDGLRLPAGELGRVRLDTQTAEVAPEGEADGKLFDVYRLVSWSRIVNGLPVQGSRVVGAVTQEGAVQRLLVNWPQFIMPAGMTLRSRDAVVAQLAQALARQAPVPTDARTLTARLSYVPERNLGTTPRDLPGDGDLTSSDDSDKVGGDPRYPTRKRHANEVVRHVPAVIVSVSTGETPYQLAVAVAAP